MGQVSETVSKSVEGRSVTLVKRGLVAGVLCLSVVLAGCGRKGSLESPAAPAAYDVAPVVQTETATGSQVVPAVPATETAQPRFFLDYLI
ncbi:hypothetical protein J0X15_17875 [Roseibium sp. CAU 1637]|uniref:Lipoprotein n=1 Tax=Roseibium limicola TaxID=2816037 RepID=A0A939ESH7_9HYPH|nr:lipoprotein [Roseibium limicola]MBO0347101.1 hypothetical protein [Roseibium limicola]